MKTTPVISHVRFKRLIFALAIICSTATIANAQQEKKVEEIVYNPNAKGDTSKRSIKSAAVGKIGEANVTINYYSPGVRKRVIWGGLVPYDEVWVTGAHNATNIEVDKEFVVGGKSIPAGKYALFTIPGKSQWTIIINKKWDQHLANDFSSEEDIKSINEKFPDEEVRKRIFEPVIKIINNPTTQIDISNFSKGFKKTYKKVGKKEQELLSPSKTKEEVSQHVKEHGVLVLYVKAVKFDQGTLFPDNIQSKVLASKVARS